MIQTFYRMGCRHSTTAIQPTDTYIMNINIIRQYLDNNSKEIRKRLILAIDLFHKATILSSEALETETLLCPFLILCNEILGRTWHSFTDNYSLLMLLTYYSCDVTLRALNVINDITLEDNSDLFHPSCIQEQATILKNKYAQLESIAIELVNNSYFTQESIINKYLPSNEQELDDLYEKYKLYVETLCSLYLDENGNLQNSPQYFMRQTYCQIDSKPSVLDNYSFEELRKLIEPITMTDV